MVSIFGVGTLLEWFKSPWSLIDSPTPAFLQSCGLDAIFCSVVEMFVMFVVVFWSGCWLLWFLSPWNFFGKLFVLEFVFFDWSLLWCFSLF